MCMRMVKKNTNAKKLAKRRCSILNIVYTEATHSSCFFLFISIGKIVHQEAFIIHFNRFKAVASLYCQYRQTI